eukprot:scaffold129452_cov22-Tisochrysis_lutea.AAC.1
MHWRMLDASEASHAQACHVMSSKAQQAMPRAGALVGRCMLGACDALALDIHVDVYSFCFMLFNFAKDGPAAGCVASALCSEEMDMGRFAQRAVCVCVCEGRVVAVVMCQSCCRMSWHASGHWSLLIELAQLFSHILQILITSVSGFLLG